MVRRFVMTPIFLMVWCLFWAIILIWLPARWQWAGSFLGGIGYGLGVLMHFVAVIKGQLPWVVMGAWPAPFGIALGVDGFSLLMLAVTAILNVACLLFDSWERRFWPQRPFFYSVWYFLLAAVTGAFVTLDWFNMYVWYELMIMASFGLVIFAKGQKSLEGIFKYVFLSILGSAFFLMGVALLYGQLGTLNMIDVALKAKSISSNSHVIGPVVMLMAIGFAFKAGIFPLFNWLPASYHLPSASVSAFFAGLLTKVGLYSLLRLKATFPAAFDARFWWILAALTMIVGVLGAANQWHVRKILTFHIMSQVGYMACGLLPGSLLPKAVLFYIIHHIVVKSNLFLVSGLLAHGFFKGVENLRQMGDVLSRSPLLGFVFAVSAFSLGGIPPLSGFWAKLWLFQGLWHQPGGLVLVFVGAFVSIWTLYSMVKIWKHAFWGSFENHQPEPISWPAWMAVMVLAGVTLFLSFNIFRLEPWFSRFGQHLADWKHWESLWPAMQQGGPRVALE